MHTEKTTSNLMDVNHKVIKQSIAIFPHGYPLFATRESTDGVRLEEDRYRYTTSWHSLSAHYTCSSEVTSFSSSLVGQTLKDELIFLAPRPTITQFTLDVAFSLNSLGFYCKRTLSILVPKLCQKFILRAIQRQYMCTFCTCSAVTSISSWIIYFVRVFSTIKLGCPRILLDFFYSSTYFLLICYSSSLFNYLSYLVIEV